MVILILTKEIKDIIILKWCPSGLAFLAENLKLGGYQNVFYRREIVLIATESGVKEKTEEKKSKQLSLC